MRKARKLKQKAALTTFGSRVSAAKESVFLRHYLNNAIIAQLDKMADGRMK